MTFVTHDPLYGRLVFPGWVADLLHMPEVQRLRSVRLINTSSYSLATLSDLRRYAHSLGVVNLTLSNGKRLREAMGEEALRTLVTASLLHDVGTAAFGHLFEYQLNLAFSWNHANAVRQLIAGRHHSLGPDAQVFAGRRSSLREALEGAGVDKNKVADAVEGIGPLSRVISARLDVDNIDNVYRMALGLGFSFDREEPAELARAYLDYVCGGLVEPLYERVNQWQTLRRRIYEVLAFDPVTLASQAVLTDAIVNAIAEGGLTSDDWIRSDESLVDRLLKLPESYEYARRFQLGQYYDLITIFWYDATAPSVDIRDPAVTSRLCSIIKDASGVHVSIYAFLDKASLSRAIELEQADGDTVSVGTSSTSTIVALFSRSTSMSRRQRARAAAAGVEVLKEYGLSPSALRSPSSVGDLFDQQGSQE